MCRRIEQVTSPDRVRNRELSRRALLRGTAVVSLGAIVAACGGSGDSSPSAASPTSDVGDGTRALGGEPIEVWRDPG